MTQINFTFVLLMLLLIEENSLSEKNSNTNTTFSTNRVKDQNQQCIHPSLCWKFILFHKNQVHE